MGIEKHAIYQAGLNTLLEPLPEILALTIEKPEFVCYSIFCGATHQ
jgi:hypothetical protein